MGCTHWSHWPLCSLGLSSAPNGAQPLTGSQVKLSEGRAELGVLKENNGKTFPVYKVYWKSRPFKLGKLSAVIPRLIHLPSSCSELENHQPWQHQRSPSAPQSPGSRGRHSLPFMCQPGTQTSDSFACPRLCAKHFFQTDDSSCPPHLGDKHSQKKLYIYICIFITCIRKYSVWEKPE